MLAQIVHLITKIDPLKYLSGKAMLTGRLAKWMMIFSKFEIHYVKRKAMKGQAIADQLVDFPLEDMTPMKIEFPNVSIMHITERTWNFFFDGSHTQNGT